MLHGGRVKRGLVVALGALAFALAPPAGSSASETGNSASTGFSTYSADVDLTGQTFTVPANPATDDFLHTLRINSVILPTGSFKVYLSAVTGGGLPTGPALFTSPTISAPINQESVTVYPNIDVTPGQKYAFYLDASTPLRISGASGDPYPGGDVVFHLISTNAWDDNPIADLAFLAQFSDGRGPTTTSLGCPAEGMVGVAAACPVGVTSGGSGFGTPTGTVGFSTIGGNGNFSGCGALSGAGTCAMSYTPTDAGSHQVFAQYFGDATHLASATSTFISVARRTTQLQGGGCVPAQVTVGQSVTCSAAVTDVAPGTVTVPTGAISWGSSLGGAFSPVACPAAPTGDPGEASCQVTFTPSAPGQHTLTAAYAGDAKHAVSQSAAAATVAVTAAPVQPPATPPASGCNPLRERLKALKRKLGKAKSRPAKRRLGAKIKRVRGQLQAAGC